eukprot:9174797-Pyramimonas_sp.AAC.1
MGSTGHFRIPRDPCRFSWTPGGSNGILKNPNVSWDSSGFFWVHQVSQRFQRTPQYLNIPIVSSVSLQSSEDPKGSRSSRFLGTCEGS